MPKIRLKHRKEHRPNVKLVLERYFCGGYVRRYSPLSDWVEARREGLRVTFNFQGHFYSVEDEFFYNKYGQVTGWHPIMGSEEFRPYMSRILNCMYKMKAGDRKVIMVEGR